MSEASDRTEKQAYKSLGGKYYQKPEGKQDSSNKTEHKPSWSYDFTGSVFVSQGDKCDDITDCLPFYDLHNGPLLCCQDAKPFNRGYECNFETNCRLNNLTWLWIVLSVSTILCCLCCYFTCRKRRDKIIFQQSQPVNAYADPYAHSNI